MTEEAELSQAEKEELHRLCEEYGVATSCVLKTLRIVNPLAQIDLFVVEDHKVAQIVSRIKAILKLEVS